MDHLAILYSSGSTGKPKYMVRSHIAVIASQNTLKESYGLGLGDCILPMAFFGYSFYYQF